MEYIHTQKNITNTPRKLRLVADMVRKMAPTQALKVLKFTNKAAALPLFKAIETALANTGSHSDHVIFKSLEINEGVNMKRFRAGTRGRAKKYGKRTSQIRIILSEEHGEVEASGKSLESREGKIKNQNSKIKTEVQNSKSEEKEIKEDKS